MAKAKIINHWPKAPRKGMKVVFLPKKDIRARYEDELLRFGWNDNMDKLCGKTATIASVKGEERHGPGPRVWHVRLDGITDQWSYSTDMIRPATKADIAQMKREAAKIAKAEAEKAAKRAKLLKTMSPAARRVVLALRKDERAFGCQRASVVALVSAILGEDLARVMGD